jgi:oligosaccharide repeat unit polymerase
MVTFALVAVGAALAAVLWQPFARARANRRRGVKFDLFSPDKIAAALLALRVLPFFFFGSFDVEGWLAPELLQSHSVEDLEMTAVAYGVLQAIAFVALVLGANSRIPRAMARKVPVPTRELSERSLFVGGNLLLLAGIGVFAAFVMDVGGFWFLLDNLASRTSITAGYGYANTVYSVLMSLGVFALIGSLRGRQPKRARAAAILMASIVAAGVLSATGGRAATLQLLFGIVVVWHYRVRPIARLGKRGALGVALALVYAVAMPILRQPDGLERATRDFHSFAADVGRNFGTALEGNRFVDTQLFIMSRFSLDNAWWGASYLDLVYAPLPRGRYPDKPPVDDGVYVYSLLKGIEARPQMSFRELSLSSWPPSTFGAMYMNFWIPGVLVGMFMLGVLYKSAYLYMEKSGYSTLGVAAYVFVMWRLQLANLNIVATGVSVAVAWIAYAALLAVFGTRRNESFTNEPRFDPRASLRR